MTIGDRIVFYRLGCAVVESEHMRLERETGRTYAELKIGWFEQRDQAILDVVYDAIFAFMERAKERPDGETDSENSIQDPGREVRTAREAGVPDARPQSRCGG